MDWVSESLKIFAGLFAVLNLFGAVPIYISMTEGRSAADQASIARTTSITVAIVLLIAAYTGELLLNFFGISIGSFRVGGGILVLMMALSMMQAKRSPVKQTPEERQEAEGRDEIAVVPIGIPVLAGPGAISTVIVYQSQISTATSYAILSGNIVLNAVITYIVLRLSVHLLRLLGRTGLNIMTRVMGLILAAIAVEFIAAGLRSVLPALAGSL